MPTIDARRPSLVGAIHAYLASRGPARHVGVHQRLDRESSGVVLFSIHREADPGLSRAFASREVTKTYLALTRRPERLPPAAWQISEPIAGSEALTQFRLIEALPRALLVEACPRTGRKHQIRIHLAGAGLEVLGDARHGVADEHPRTLLHALRLELLHPVTGAPLRFQAEPPDDFRHALQSLRAGARPATRRR